MLSNKFRCVASVHSAYIVLEPIGPPQGTTAVIVGTGRGPCELGKVADPSIFKVGGVYEIEIRNASGEAEAPGNN